MRSLFEFSRDGNGNPVATCRLFWDCECVYNYTHEV